MSCPGGNYIVPGADPCGGGGGGAIESINGLVGAITVNSIDGSLNVTATSATDISITNPNLISLNGTLGITTLTSVDDSITITNSANNIDLSTAGGGSIILHFSGVTNAQGQFVNNIGDNEGYIMLDTTYAVAVSQTSLTQDALSFVVTKTTSSVTVTAYQPTAIPEPNVSIDCILVATNYRKAVATLTFLDLPIVSVVDGSTAGGGSPLNWGSIATGPPFTTPGSPTYINPTLNPTVLMQLTVSGIIGTIPIVTNTLGYGVYGPGVDNLVCGFSMPTPGTVQPINNGSGIPSVNSSPNAIFSATIPYSLLSLVATMNYGIFLSFPTPGLPLSWYNVGVQIRLNYYING